MPRAVEIGTARFRLRSLTPDDATDRYLSWFADADAQRYIDSASATSRQSDLKRYIRERAGRDDVLFLGIFDKATGTHVGNIKYEPVDPHKGSAVMGILIGDPAFRGKGVTGEVLRASAEWLKRHRGIHTIILGVSEENHAAIRAYEKVGFVAAETPPEVRAKRAVRMVLHL